MDILSPELLLQYRDSVLSTYNTTRKYRYEYRYEYCNRYMCSKRVLEVPWY